MNPGFLLPGLSTSSGVILRTAAAAKSLQSCPTLCDPIDISPPGSPAPGILQARTEEPSRVEKELDTTERLNNNSTV